MELKLNWDITDQPAADHASDLCYFEGGHLVGYAPLDGDGEELEVTAAVLPPHRRQGIFRKLLDAARRETHMRGGGRLLLVSYPASVSGAAAVQALGLPYISSEYRMEVQAEAIPLLDVGRMRLIQVDASNVADLFRLRALSFGGEPASSKSLLGEISAEGARYFLAERDGVCIGQIGVVNVGDGIYIRAVGIIPEYRRLGYGRQLLAATLRAMLSEGHQHFTLEVATDNIQALSLYESCGFQETLVFDYYDIRLTASETIVAR